MGDIEHLPVAFLGEMSVQTLGSCLDRAACPFVVELEEFAPSQVCDLQILSPVLQAVALLSC